jgi:hypothetical protein
MASILPSYYHASAAIPITNHGDFFNTHGMFQQLTAATSHFATTGGTINP